ncbi:hypothetical protein E2P81_ATG08619 [Venturia nashicola]|uniref:Transcription factor Iwr1 domain-containing protein n=1 Tax=Venturia nashicola TaxID=86259 RepID=A0A4Z1P447_9PEZI|nr:hypothetical protein E6O75_ATG08810 [Venturia nashicola]TLD20955.1 hypothetical protein E2P81_ATG08619 [Venturia nashicola]
MSTPTAAPPVIRIKRKRDDAPLEVLHLERGLAKRRVTEDIYVFRRYQQQSQPIPKPPLKDNGIPKVRATQPGEEKRDPWALKKVETPYKPSSHSPASSSTPRRFHLSRPATPSFASPANRRARKADVATFIERRGAIGQRQGASDADQVDGARILHQGRVTEVAAAERKLKRPKAKSRTPIIGSRSNEDVRGQNAASEKDSELLSKMAAWAEEAERSESSDNKVDSRKPKATSVDGNDGGGDEMEIDNEGDYVYDTYVRHLVAADTELEVVGEGAVGHLVISEEDQELWDAYVEDEDGSEKEFDTDSEDSNAEDYYGADYPEDEVAEDDEYDRGAYEEYRKYASDDEQWGNGLDSDDSDGAVGSGGENEEFSTGQAFARAVRRDQATKASTKEQTDIDGGEEMSE